MRKIIFVTVVMVIVLGLSCKEIQGPMGPPGPPGSGFESLTDPAVMPKIIYSYPPANTVGPYSDFGDNIIRLRFNKRMDPKSLLRAISLSVPNGNIRIDTIYSSSDNEGNALLYVAVNRSSSYYNANFLWQIGETYHLVVGTSAKDVNENHLPEVFEMSFQPEPYFRVKTASPAPGSIDIDRGQTIWLYLNSPIDTSMFSYLHINPPITGLWMYSNDYWSGRRDSATLYYSTTKSLSLNTLYSIKADTVLKDKYGHPVGEQFNVSFRTIPFKVTSTYPGNGGTNVPLFFSGIGISFSGPISGESAMKAISITPLAEGYVFNPYEGSIIYNLTAPLSTGKIYTVTVDTSIRSVDGDKLDVPYSFSFSTEQLNVRALYPKNGATNIPLNTKIWIAFSAPIDSSTLSTSFSISPPVKGSFKNESGSFYFIPSNDLNPSTTYSVTIDTSLHSKGGSNLPSQYKFSFTTIPFKVISTSPYNGDSSASLLYSKINVYFSAPIDTVSVKQSFTITPVLSGNFRFDNAKSFSFITNQFLPETRYTVTIDTTIRSIGGSRLAEPYTFSFKTGYLRVTYTSPVAGTLNVPASTGISVDFSMPIDTATVRQAFYVSPLTEGYLYLSASRIYYTPVPALLPSTLYTVMVDTSIRSALGGRLSMPFTFTFWTRPFTLAYVYPFDGGNDIPLLSKINVGFTNPVDTSSVKRAFNIKPKTSGRFSYSSSSAEYDVYFTPDNELLSDTVYTVTIDTSLASINGTHILQPRTFSFRTDEFRIISTHPSNGQTNVARNTYVEILTLGNMDTSTARSAFMLPGSSGMFYFYGSSSFYFVPAKETPLDANTTYTVTISTALKSKAGSPIKAPYSFSFTTGN